VQPHALEEHAPALAGPAAVSAPGGAPEGEGDDGAGGGGASGARDAAVSLAALWCAPSALTAGGGVTLQLLAGLVGSCGIERAQWCMDTPRRQP